jgi:hypothetical protein
MKMIFELLFIGSILFLTYEIFEMITNLVKLFIR